MFPYLNTSFVLFLRKKVHPGDLARGCSDLRVTWFLLLRWRRHCRKMRRKTGGKIEAFEFLISFSFESFL